MKIEKAFTEGETKYSVKLPNTNKNGCYEIRLESIGGLGANICGKLLGELGAKYLGLNASAFSSYGSEKRGSPVKSYVRLSDKRREILHNSPIESPNLLVLFHEALSNTQKVTAGADSQCVIVVNTPLSPGEIREKLKIHAGYVCCVDALELSLKSKSRVNMIMLGAIARASGFIPVEAVKDIVADTLGKKYPALLQNNLQGVEQGFENVSTEYFEDDGKYEFVPYGKSGGALGYKNAPIGGANTRIGSTVSNELSASRQGYIPLFLIEKCIHCGLCDTTCPDMVFQFLPGEYRGKQTMVNRGLDYHHCKGCLRCVDVCPTGALVVGKESEHQNKKWFVRNKDLIADNIDFDISGADPWVSGESYLDEKRVDGGLM